MTIYEKFLKLNDEFEILSKLYKDKKIELFDAMDIINKIKIGTSLMSFYNDVMKLKILLNDNIKMYQEKRKYSKKVYLDFIKKKQIKINDGKYSIPAKHLVKYNELKNEYLQCDDFIFTSYKSYIVNVVSCFDSYLLTIIKNLKDLNNNLIYDSIKESKDKIFTYKDIFEGSYTISDYEKQIINNHLMGDTRLNQIKWLFRLIGYDASAFLENVANINSFVEFTELRNLLVHNQGIVNDKFLEKLFKNNISTDKYKKNKPIAFEDKEVMLFTDTLIRIVSYLNNYACFYVKDLSDNKLYNNIDELTLELIKCKNYQLCENIIHDYLNFDNDDTLDNVLKINLCQIYKIKKYTNKLRKTLKTISSEDIKILLCKSILLNNDDLIYKYTLEVNLSSQSFYTWPIFEFVKDNKMFLKAFKERFKTSYKDEIVESEPIE